MPKLYECTIPLRLAVEAETKAEAAALIDRLWVSVMDELPAGAGVFMKEREREAHIEQATVERL